MIFTEWSTWAIHEFIFTTGRDATWGRVLSSPKQSLLQGWGSRWENLCSCLRCCAQWFFSCQLLLHSMWQKEFSLWVTRILGPPNTKYPVFRRGLTYQSFKERGNRQFHSRFSLVYHLRNWTTQNLRIRQQELPASLMLFFLSKRIFSGLMSLWIILFWWRYFTAEIICRVILFVSSSSNRPFLMSLL